MAEKMTLEPCPFCGAPAAKNRNPGDRWVYYCPNGHTGYLRYKEWQARAHLAQPAQAVDVGAVRCVIDELNGYCEASDDSCYGTLATSLVRGYTEQLARALSGEKAGPVGGWRPIETAPKDGTEIDVWCASDAEGDDGGYRIARVWWCCVDRCWRSYSDERMQWAHQPTHWMPLPASPAPDKEGL